MSRAGRLALVIVAAIALGSTTLVQRSSGGIRVSAHETDVTAFGRDMTVTQETAGDVVVIGGTAHVDARVGGDVVAIAGDVILGPAARVEGDVTSLGGKVVGANSSNVRGEVVVTGASRDIGQGLAITAKTTRAIRDHESLLSAGIKIALLSLWLIAALAITVFFSREVRSSSVELRAQPMHVMTLGLVGFTSFIITAVVLSYLIPYLIGVPLLASLGAFAFVAKVYGMVAVFHMAGTALFGAKTPEQLRGRRIFRGDTAMVLAGFLVLGLLRMIPVVGNFIWMAASVAAIGTALATKFGKRDPWFLAVRPNES
jgi:hypothetical protein